MTNPLIGVEYQNPIDPESFVGRRLRNEYPIGAILISRGIAVSTIKMGNQYYTRAIALGSSIVFYWMGNLETEKTVALYQLETAMINGET